MIEDYQMNRPRNWVREGKIMRAIEAAVLEPEIYPNRSCATCGASCAYKIDGHELWCSWWSKATSYAAEVVEDAGSTDA